jgi:hypothetical protein
MYPVIKPYVSSDISGIHKKVFQKQLVKRAVKCGKDRAKKESENVKQKRKTLSSSLYLKA